MDVEKYLDGVFEVVKDVLLGIKWLKACSIVVFGSAARPEDFVKGVSDVDVLVLTREEPSKRRYSFVVSDSKVDVVLFTVAEFEKLVRWGNPLAFVLKRCVVLYDGCFKHILKLKPEITEHTRDVLRKSIFAALGLSLESYYFLEDYVKALSHLYHSLRHLIRYKASFYGKFPISDQEVCEYCRGRLKDVYVKLLDLRKRGVQKSDLEELMDAVIRLVAEELNLRVTSLKDIEDKVEGSINLVVAGEIDGYIVFRVETYKDGRRKIVEVKDGRVREVDRLFF